MNKKPVIKVRFWGVRGSYPAPGAHTVYFGGNTPCVEIQAGEQTIILDAGTGIIPLGKELLNRCRPVQATLFFSHMHHDHTQGFPFFVPAFVRSTRLHIYGPQTFERDLQSILAQSMAPPVFPVTLQDMSAALDIHALTESTVIYLDSRGGPPQMVPPAAQPPIEDAHRISIRVLRSYAHPGGVMIYRLDWAGLAVVYATDTEGYDKTDRRLVEFARDADLLIHDAQYTEEHYLGVAPGSRTTQGWGHSTPSMACDVACSAGVGLLALFHFDPTYDDQTISNMQTGAHRHFLGAFAAREGMQVSLDHPGARAGQAVEQTMERLPAAVA